MLYYFTAQAKGRQMSESGPNRQFAVARRSRLLSGKNPTLGRRGENRRP